MTTFITRMRGSGQTRPEGGAHALLGPARPAGQWAFAGVAVTSLGGPLALPRSTRRRSPAAASSAGLAMAAAAAVFGFPRVAGVILVEYLALSRLATAVTGWPLRQVVTGIGAVMVATAPVLLINPDRIYNPLLTPSLFALWLSQLITFAVYPRFLARQGGRALLAWVLGAGASALAVYGLWTTVATSTIGPS